jgi:hypothetical protein
MFCAQNFHPIFMGNECLESIPIGKEYIFHGKLNLFNFILAYLKLVSVILTFSFLLLKLKDNASTPIHTIILKNATFDGIAANINGSAKI